MSMSVDVSLRDQDGRVLPAVQPAKPVLQTNAYARQLQDADALIEQIIADNLARG
jgi:membrane fusion protein (multidrug efflux system)